MSEVQIKHEIVKRKRLLRETDYIAIKYAEGVLSEEEYAPMKQQRLAWRNEIEMFEQRLNCLPINKGV